MAENVSLREAILKKSCFTCSGTMVPAELLAENRPLLMENGKLRGEYMRATALLNQILLTAPPAKRPPVVAHVNEGQQGQPRRLSSHVPLLVRFNLT